MLLPLVMANNLGAVFASWESVDIDAQLFVPADYVNVTAPVNQGGVPVPWPQVKTASQISFTLAGLPVFTGRQTRAENQVGEGVDEIRLSAHSAVKDMIDCPPMIPFKKPTGTLAAFAGEICAPFGIVPKVDAAAGIPRTESASASDTEPAYSILERFARDNGVWIWTDPLGVLHIESLSTYYAIPPVDDLSVPPAGPASASCRVRRVQLIDNAGERYTRLTVRGRTGQRARHGNKATGVLTGVAEGMFVDAEATARGYNRPLVVNEPDAKNIELATRRATRDLMIQLVQGTKIILVVDGWTTLAGVPWNLTQMVTFSYPQKAVAGLFMVAGRRFSMAFGVERTELTLIQPGML